MSELALGLTSPLAMTEADAMRLTQPQRNARLDDLIAEAKGILSEAIAAHVTDDGKTVAAVVALFSGGDDSTVLTHLFKREVDYAAHANTTIGIEQTREFVRNTCEEWGIPLIEKTPPNELDHYRNLVLTNARGKKGQALGGFPGPAMHFKMYARLKERVFRAIVAMLNPSPHQSRVVLIAGRRRQESKRREHIVDMERRGSTVWVSPFVNWTKTDLNTYRIRYRIPRNHASGVIHMSGECLCGSMASPGERDEIAYWFPGDFEEIAELEALLADREDIPEHRKTWGWGADPAMKAAEKEYAAQFGEEAEEQLRSPFLCDSCDGRFQAALFEGGAA